MRILTIIAALSVMSLSASAAEEPSSAVTLIDHEKMAAGFAKGEVTKEQTPRHV